MRIYKRILGAIGIVLAVALSLGATAYAVMEGGGEGEMMGVIVAADNIALEVPAQPGATRTLVVETANVPGPSWIVVHLDDNGKPGMRVGLQHVDPGANANVSVALEGDELTDELIVALHADRGVVDSFDFAMDQFEVSPDKPYFVDGMEMATRVRVK
jgi:hypothetical protein